MPEPPDERTRALDRALGFLQHRQLAHGEFAMYLGADQNLANPAFDSTPFATTLVIDALTLLHDVRASEMADRAALFLRSEMEFGGVWRYFSTRQHKHARLPPDLDDTACVSFALTRMGQRAPDNRWAFRSARDATGRFRTWLLPSPRNCRQPRFLIARGIGFAQARRRARRVPAPADEDPRFRVMRIDRDDVDVVVNTNVLLYLGERPETEAALEFVIRTVRQETNGWSHFYLEPLALYHAVARAYRHSAPSLGVLSDRVVSRVHACIAERDAVTPTAAALAASALLTFEADRRLTDKLIGGMLSAQREDGGWKAAPFYNVWGSEELTTALCLEVLARATSDATAPDRGVT